MRNVEIRRFIDVDTGEALTVMFEGDEILHYGQADTIVHANINMEEKIARQLVALTHDRCEASVKTHKISEGV